MLVGLSGVQLVPEVVVKLDSIGYFATLKQLVDFVRLVLVSAHLFVCLFVILSL